MASPVVLSRLTLLGGLSIDWPAAERSQPRQCAPLLSLSREPAATASSGARKPPLNLRFAQSALPEASGCSVDPGREYASVGKVQLTADHPTAARQ
jgi:hypothetical protein